MSVHRYFLLTLVGLPISGAFANEPAAVDTRPSTTPTVITPSNATVMPTAKPAPSSPRSEQVLPTVQVTASRTSNATRDISAVTKTTITQAEMQQYGDQSVSDSLRRAVGMQMPSGGQRRRGAGAGAGRMRGSPPTFLINGEPVQGGPRSGMSLIDTLTPDMIDRIEVSKQPSVVQSGSGMGGIINIILREPLKSKPFSGSVRIGLGDTLDSDDETDRRRQINAQLEGRQDKWSYALNGNIDHSEGQTSTVIEQPAQTRTDLISVERDALMIAPRVQYALGEQEKLFADLFYRRHTRQSARNQTTRENENSSTRLNLRYENRSRTEFDKFRLGIEQQSDTDTRQSLSSIYHDTTDIDGFSLGYDGQRSPSNTLQYKFGAQARFNHLESLQRDALKEQQTEIYAEGSWRFHPAHVLTFGLRQEWLSRSGLVDADFSNSSPVLSYHYLINGRLYWQFNLSRAFRTPQVERLTSAITISTDSDAGSLNNPDRGGNPQLQPEKVTAAETTLGYNTTAGGWSVTAYRRDVDDFIENVVRLENGRYVSRPFNQANALTQGVELSARYALKQTEKGHAFSLNGQVNTIDAQVLGADDSRRKASGIAPYNANIGLAYSYQPWRLSTSINLTYTPRFTRPLDDLPYYRMVNQQTGLDWNISRRFQKNWSLGLSVRDLVADDDIETLIHADGSLYQKRTAKAVPSALLTLEKKF